MKKNLYIILGLILPFISQAQITIVSTDMAQIGDVVTRNADTLATVTAGPSGANQNWIMTTATPHVTETTTVLAPSATPYASSFANSNLAMTNDNASFLYFSQNTSSLVTTGFAGDLLNNGTIISAPFNPTLLLHNFPRNYGSNFTDTYGLNVTTSGASFGVDQVKFKRTAIVHDTTDGWGNLTTPVGTYQSLRVKHVEYSHDSIWIRLLPPPLGSFTFFQTTKDTAISYNWLAKETKLALAELTLDSVGNPKKYTWSQVPPSTGIEKTGLATIHAQIYPNPAKDEMSLQIHENTTESAFSLQIYNVLGQIVMEKELSANSSNSYALSINDLSPGIYTWQLNAMNSKRNASGKLSIVR